MSADKEQSRPSAQILRALTMLEILSSEPIRGLSNKDLAGALKCPPPYVTRTADVLIEKGWVRKDDATGRFHITTHFSRLTLRVMDAFGRAESDLATLKRNFTLTN
ncbi:MAG: helix-turn-helix domain-containing protein [Collimonas sp.]|uniref:helix-turn-helix domain-containing protein n=1 Tax=Collimonas sp. TaxID=1963772 RepID=UPI003266C5A3